MEEYKDIKIFSLENPGKIYFIFSDKYNIFFFFYDIEENKFYKITTDKYYNIEYIDEIEIPAQCRDFKDIKLFKPLKDNRIGEYNFNGIIITKEGDYKFTIDETNTLKIVEKTEYIDKRQFNLLTCLKNIDVISYIQKKDKIYLVGYDNEYSSYIYGIVNIEKDKFYIVYTLSTDEGYIVPLTINVDYDESRVLIGGYIEVLDNNDELIGIVQYIDQFLLL